MYVCKLSKLERLDLQNSAVKELPEAIGQLTQLQMLDLRKNELTTYSIPFTIDGWKCITRLCLAYVAVSFVAPPARQRVEIDLKCCIRRVRRAGVRRVPPATTSSTSWWTRS